MLMIRTAGRHTGAHRAAADRAGQSTRLIDGRYKTFGRCKSPVPGCKRWLAHDVRLNRTVSIEVRSADPASMPDAALRAHTDLLGRCAPAVLLDAGYWAARPDRPVTYVVTPPPAAEPAGVTASRRWVRRRVAQVA